MALPRSSDWVDTELISVGRPVGGCTEDTAAGTVGRIASELMVDRSHRVLGNAPGVIGLHGDRWRNDQSRRLAGSEPVVSTVPRSLIGLRTSPIITPGRVPNPSSIGTNAVGIGTACGEVRITEHVSLNRSADSMHTLTNMRYCTMKMRASSIQVGTMCMTGGGRTIVAVGSRAVLSLNATASKHRRQGEACERKLPKHLGSAPVKNSVRKKIVSVEAQQVIFHEARLNNLFRNLGSHPGVLLVSIVA